MKRFLLALLPLLFCTLAHAAPSIRFSAVGTYASSVSSFTVSLAGGNDPQAGDTVCAVIPYHDTSTPGFSSVTDGTNAYTQAVASTAFSTNGNAEIWCFQNISTQSGTYTVTATATTAGSLIGYIVLVDIQGVAASSIDQSGQAAAQVATLSPTASSANTTANAFEIAAVAVPNNAGSATNVPAGWTALANDYSGTGNNAFTVVYKVASAIETTTATFTWTTTQWSGSVVLSLKDAGSALTHGVLNSNGHAVNSNAHAVYN